MAGRNSIRSLSAAVSLALAASVPCLAQRPGGDSTAAYQGQQSLSTSAYQDATVGPSTPFLSPYLMTMGQANPDYMTYLYLQNQRNGGIGSGVISGTRVAPGVPAGSTVPSRGASAMGVPGGSPARGGFPNRPPAELNRVTLPMAANAPGGNTGAYYMRGPRTNPDASRYFNRTTPARNQGR